MQPNPYNAIKEIEKLNTKGDCMEYRSLENESFEKIHHCFSEAFSDYIIKVQLPFEKFQRTMIRNGVNLKFSIGLYDKGNLVGFILNGVGTWNNIPTVYDSGTGIIKEYRGKKHSKKMFEVLKQKLENNFSQYLLEVIQTNTPALTLYRHQGFEIERELACFRMSRENVPKAETDLDLYFKKISSLQWGLLRTFWNSPPSWQNSIQAVERVSDHFEKIGVYLDNKCVGYGIFYPQSGEIVHIAVRKDMRRRGIGSMLLNKISVESKGSPHLRIINVDRKDQETIDFFRKNKFINDVNQYEMILHLNK